MKIQYLLRLCYSIVIAACALCATQATVHAQEFLPMDPLSPIAPTEPSQCNAYSEAWSRLASELERLHQNCLEANEKNKSQANRKSGEGVGSTCTYSSCQALHTRKYEVEAKRGPEVEACRAQVKEHQENEARRREAEEKQRREAEEREEHAREEQKQKEAAKREQAEADKQKRSDEAEQARKREETNQKLIQLAAEQQRREQEALARRTEERQREMEELKKRELEVNDRYEQAIEKQTRQTQDDLLAQMKSKAGTENSIFPTPDSRKDAGQEFDLSSVSGAGVKSDSASLPEVSSEYEEAIAPERNSYFSTLFQNARDYVSPILEKGRSSFVEGLRDNISEQVNEVRDTIIAGVFDGNEGFRTAESMVKKYFDNSFKDPSRDLVSSAYDAHAKGLVDEAAVDLSRAVAKTVGLRPQSGGLEGALTDVAVKIGAEKLSGYARDTFVDHMTAEFSGAYRKISEYLTGPSDRVTQPVTDTALLRLPALVSKIGSPAAAIKAIYDYNAHMVNAMGEMFDRLMKSELFGTAPPDYDPDK